MPETLRILIVEDNRQQAAEVRNHLETLGFEVVAVIHDKDTFVKQVGNYSFDLAVVDVRLDGDTNFDGLKIARHLMKDPNLFVLIHTAFEQSKVWSVLHQTKHVAIISKPAHQTHTWRGAVNSILTRVHGQEAFRLYKLPDGSRSAGQLNAMNCPDFWFQNKRIRYGSIYYVKTTKDKHLRMQRANGPTICRSVQLSEFVEQCKHPNMVQIHRSHMVNWDLVEDVYPDHLIVETPEGERIKFSIGANFKAEVKARTPVIRGKKRQPKK